MPYALVPALFILLMIGRIYRPRAAKAPGEPVRRHPLPLLSRLRLHAWPASGAILGVAVGAALGWVPSWVVAVFLAATAAVVLVPVAYLLTTEGIVCGWTSPRRWTEFAGVARRAGGARLQGIGGRGGLSVWLAGSHDIDETVLLLRRLVRGSYQGHAAGAASAATPDNPARPVGIASASVR